MRRGALVRKAPDGCGPAAMGEGRWGDGASPWVGLKWRGELGGSIMNESKLLMLSIDDDWAPILFGLSVQSVLGAWYLSRC